MFILRWRRPTGTVPDEDYHREISKELAKHIRKLVPVEKELTALVVGLGNRDVTPDALGPDVVSNLRITRHVIQEYGVQSMGKEIRQQYQRPGARCYGPDRHGRPWRSSAEWWMRQSRMWCLP